MRDFPLVTPLPIVDPWEAFSKLPKEGSLFLDSAAASQQSRYSFIALLPFQWIKTQGERGKIDPFDQLQEQLALYHCPLIDGLPPFQGGAAGVFGYELGTYLEPIQPAKNNDQYFPDLLVGFYDVVIGFDHHKNQAWLFSTGFPELDPKKRIERALQRRDEVLALLERSSYPLPLGEGARRAGEGLNITSMFTQATYETAIEQVQEYIRAGDIFQACLSQRFQTVLDPNLTPWDLYVTLRQRNPAPFAAYFQHQDVAIASASPERFLQLRNQQVETRPIKGTIRRDKDLIRDQQLAAELEASEKDRAENIMIVDLLRNDLSRVCLPHTVKITQLCGLETFATVHHLVSAVEGTLAPNKTAIDLLKATFPGGSITGAPKIRAMQIIAELEPVVRGPYCGSIGYIGFNGQMDLSITIRTFVLKGNQVTFHAGGAITIDSDPTLEYQETLTKAKALMQTLNYECDLLEFERI